MLKGITRTKGVWAGSGCSGRKARTKVMKRVERSGKRKYTWKETKEIKESITDVLSRKIANQRFGWLLDQIREDNGRYRIPCFTEDKPNQRGSTQD